MRLRFTSSVSPTQTAIENLENAFTGTCRSLHEGEPMTRIRFSKVVLAVYTTETDRLEGVFTPGPEQERNLRRGACRSGIAKKKKKNYGYQLASHCSQWLR